MQFITLLYVDYFPLRWWDLEEVETIRRGVWILSALTIVKITTKKILQM